MTDECQRMRELLAEAVEFGEWTHEHCDEDSGGTHRFDREGWEKDVERLLSDTVGTSVGTQPVPLEPSNP